MKRALNPLIPALEAFLYQGPSPLYRALSAIFQDALNGDSKAIDRVGPVIHDMTGLKIDFKLIQSSLRYDLYVMFVLPDVNHVMRDEINPVFRHLEGQKLDLNPIRDFLKESEGLIDKHGRVKGVFSQIPATIYGEFSLFDGTLTAEEIAAGVLHEVGHVYGYIATMGRTVVSSLLIQETMTTLEKTDDLMARRQLIEDVGMVLEFEGLDAEAIADPKEKDACEAVLIRNSVVKLTSQLGDSRVFSGETEFIADSYATRSGAASPLTSLYLKIVKYHNHLQVQRRSTYLLTEALKVASLIVAAIHPIALLVGGMIAGLSIASGRDELINRNSPVDRLEHVHADLITLLKDQTLPREYTQSLLNDANFVSALRDSLKERLTIVMLIWVTLSPATRRLYKQQQLQRSISKLVNNDLFAQAAALRVISHS